MSRLRNVPLSSNDLYYVVIDGYGGDGGNNVLSVNEFEPCALVCPAGGISEGEPPLVDEYEDTYNGGCNSPGLPFQDLYGDVNGELTLCGVSGWYEYEGSSHRDTDWFILHSDETGMVHASAGTFGSHQFEHLEGAVPLR